MRLAPAILDLTEGLNGKKKKKTQIPEVRIKLGAGGSGGTWL